MLRFDRHCVYCHKALPPNQRLDAFFCPPPKTQDEARRKKPKNRPVSVCWRLWNLKRRAVRRLSDAIEELEKTLSQGAQAASWYRVQGVIDGKAWMFPATDRPTLRFDGALRQTHGFLVHPFEPPVVPKTGSYAFTFYDSQGKAVENSAGFYEFLLDPVLIVSPENGVLIRDFHE